jgi:menaquinone-dependent protoporphyrinogen IX oxidase
MKTLVIYDSKYGHTEKVALAISKAINGQVIYVGEANPTILKNYDLVIIGSPTHGGFPTEGIHNLSKTKRAFQGRAAAVFDTRTKTTIGGYAAPKIAKNLGKNGGKLLVPPEGFLVLGTEGPLADGELERAVVWAAGITRKNEENRNV